MTFHILMSTFSTGLNSSTNYHPIVNILNITPTTDMLDTSTSSFSSISVSKKKKEQAAFTYLYRNKHLETGYNFK